MKEREEKRRLRIFLLLPIFLITAALACVATACGEKGHSHEWVEHAATDSTCTVAGHELYYTCGGCEKIFDAQKNEISAIPEKPLVPHEWGEGVKTADATCTHGEEFTYTCSVGGETKKEYVGEALGHVWGEYEVTDRDLTPDCENDGTQTAVCTRCHDAYNTISKPALGHSYGELIERQDAQRGTLGSPCQTGVEAHYFCNVCKYYLDADKKRTTLDALTIDLHKDDDNLQWKFTDTYHEHVCRFCGETIEEGDHSFEDWSTFTCSICKQNVEKRFVYAFDDINDYCRSNWEPVPDYKAEIATLPQGVTLPDGVINSGDNALCFTANRNKGEGKYQIWPALYIGGLKDIIASAENSYRFTIWIYSTAAAKSGIDNWFVFGNATLNEDGYYFDSDISSQSPMNKNSFEPNFTANGWYSFTMTVADIKAACTKQGRVEAEWIHFSCEATENMKLYFYAAYLYPEQPYSIEKSNDVHTYVKGNETSSILPLSTVRVEAVGLEFGKGLKVVDDNGNQIAIIYGSTGSFVMPYSNVEIREIDVLNVPLETLNMPLFSGNISLPKTHDSFYDSYTVAFKKNGQPLDASKFTYDEKTHIVTFTESGTYTVEYSLTKEGQNNIPVLIRNVNAGVVNGIDSIVDECTPWFAPGETADWNQSMVTIAEAGITKPESAIDVGDNLLKCTVQKQQYVAPVFALGDFLEHLSELNDSDYLRIWVYYTGTWSGGSDLHEWNFWGTGNPSRLVNDVSRLPQELGKANTWVGLDFTVAEIKAQLEKQNQTYQNFDWFKSNAYLYTMISLSNPCDIYFYSVEFHKETAREIDASSVQGVTVQEKAIPLNTVEVDASGLEYGKVVEVVNAETNQVIATINGTGSFVMPYANVTLRVTDIFEEPLDNLQLPLYEGSAALPELYNGLYDSYTLTVKQNGAEVLGGKYTFDTATETITFNEPGVYELTYTLTYGDNSKKLTCTATVGVVNGIDSIVDECTPWFAPGETADWNQSMVTIAEAGITKPESAIDVGDNLLKCTVQKQQYVAPVFALGDFLEHLSELNDSDYLRIWVYYTGTWSGGSDLHEWNFWGTGNPSRLVNDVSRLPQELGKANTWVGLDFTVAEIKAQLEKQNQTYQNFDWFKSNAYLYTMISLSNPCDIYFYSVEFHKETAREIDASSVQGVTVQEKAIPLNTVEVDASGLEYGKVVEVVNAETNQVIATINGTGSFVMPYANVTLRVTDIFEEPLDNLQLPLYEGSAALPELYNGLYDSYTLTVKQNGAEVLGGKYTFDTATETITFNEPGVYELTYTLTYGDNSKKLTCTATVGVLTEYSNANVPNYVDYCSNQLWGKGDAAAAKQLNDVSLNKPSSAIDVDSNTVLQYTTTGNQVAHALKVSYLTDILTNGSDNDYISIWLYRTGAAVSDQNFWMIGNAEDPYEWEGKMYVNYNADSTDGQKIWVNGENKSATYSEEYAQYVGDEWFELKFTVKELKDQLNKQGADLETMQPQWILLSFGLSSATDSVSYYSIEYHKA